VALSFSAIISAWLLHRRYARLLAGEMKQRRVIGPAFVRFWNYLAGKSQPNETKSKKKKTKQKSHTSGSGVSTQPDEPTH